MISRELLVALVMLWHQAQGERCHYVLHGERGVIRSPNYPAEYPRNVVCTWLIRVEREHTITLRVKSFLLEGSKPSCSKDFLMIYDGANATANSFDSPYCGRAIEPSLKSSSNVLFIKFRSDAARVFQGFSLEYAADKSCNKSILSDNGTIPSPKYPDDYPPNVDCHWSIETTNGTKVRLDIKDFVMEEPQAGIGQCYDFLAIYDVIKNRKKLIGNYCGKSIPPTMTSKTNKLVMHLSSDDTVSSKGFLISFSAIASRDERGTSSPPLKGKDIRRGLNCTESDFKCSNGYCINQELRCNQIDDCGDHSDEVNCAAPCSDGSGDCDHRCHQHAVWGPYCSCDTGYTLAVDKKACQDINECLSNNGGCGDVCSNYIGGFKCECSQNGYQIGADGRTCQDIDECLAGPCEHVCRNTVGSFVCSCKKGFRPTPTGRCIDLNECATGVPFCVDCVNTIGSYRCNCDKGFVAENNATRCKDVDECTSGESSCSQLCTNTYGSFHCHCRQGYAPFDEKGRICVDVNECQSVGRQCEQMCVNSPGSYFCACRSGFRLVNRTRCIMDGDCGPNSCQFGCRKVEGRIRCTCPDGYILGSNGTDCHRLFNQSECGQMKSFKGPPHELSVAANSWPWQAYLRITFSSSDLQLTKSGCMATFISSYYLLTTAHCLYLGRSQIKPSQLRVLTGITKGKQGEREELLVDGIIFHPNYSRRGSRSKYDLAMIRLLKPINANPSLQPICTDPVKKVVDNNVVYIISWGRMNEKRTSDVLRESHIQMKNATKCSWLRQLGYDTKGLICAGHVPPLEKAVCLADSGTPLMIRSASQEKWYLHGILIHGAGYPRILPCSKKYNSNGFYDIAEYEEWIQEFVK